MDDEKEIRDVMAYGEETDEHDDVAVAAQNWREEMAREANGSDFVMLGFAATMLSARFLTFG